MSKAVFLRPHNIYTDYEGDWIQVQVIGQKKQITQYLTHEAMNRTIKGIDNETQRNKILKNFEKKEIIKIKKFKYYPLDLFANSHIIKAGIISKQKDGSFIFNSPPKGITYYVAYKRNDGKHPIQPSTPSPNIADLRKNLNKISCNTNFTTTPNSNVSIVNDKLSGCKPVTCENKDIFFEQQKQESRDR